MNDSNVLICQEILGYCEKIENRVEEYSINRDSFVSDDALFDMLLMPIFQIGELANALSDEFVLVHPEIPWHAIKGFRNIIAHDYGIVDPYWAWNTVEQDIPILAEELRKLII